MAFVLRVVISLSLHLDCSDVENYTGSIPGSQTVKKMLHSVTALWDMQVPPEIVSCFPTF